MNILVVGKFYIEGFAWHAAETLRSMGHDVIDFEPGVKYDVAGNLLVKRWRQAKDVVYSIAGQFRTIQKWRAARLYRKVEGKKIDLVLSCGDFLMPEEVRLLKAKTGARMAMWFPDPIHNFSKAFFLNAGYDALFFKDPYIVHILGRNLKRPVYYLPECCNPKYHRSVDLSGADLEKYGCDITNAGNLYSYRAAFMENLPSKLSVKFWGNPPPLWMDVSGIKPMLQCRYVVLEEKSKAFRGAKIVLNNLHPAEMWGINVRAFEAAAAGAFQMIDWRPALFHLFDIGKEIVAFKNKEDLLEKIEHYLPREAERLEIAARGMKRAHADHTYQKRLDCLLRTMFGSGSGFAMPDPKILKWNPS